MKQIRWNQSVNYHASSKCDRFEIVPLFSVGIEKPVEYRLKFRGEKVGLFPTQQKAKSKAAELREVRPGESLCKNAMNGRHVYNASVKNSGLACTLCTRLRSDIEKKL